MLQQVLSTHPSSRRAPDRVCAPHTPHAIHSPRTVALPPSHRLFHQVVSRGNHLTCPSAGASSLTLCCPRYHHTIRCLRLLSHESSPSSITPSAPPRSRCTQPIAAHCAHHCHRHRVKRVCLGAARCAGWAVMRTEAVGV